MNAFSNSLFFTADLGLVKFYLKQAVENSSSKSLKELDFTESQKLVKDFIFRAVQQTVKDCSNVGNWKDEKNYVLFKIHEWLFLSWVTTSLENTCEMFVPVGSVFYLQVLRICSFENFLLQCLCNVSEETAKVLMQNIAQSSKLCGEKDKNLLLQLVEQCLLQFGGFKGRCGKISDVKLCHVLIQIARNVERLSSQVDILLKLTYQLHQHLSKLKKSLNHLCNIGNVFTKKINLIEFNERTCDLMREVESKKTAMPRNNSAVNLVEDSAKESFPGQVEGILCLVFCVKHLLTIEWRSIFSWESIDLGEEVIDGVKDLRCHGVLFDVFTACKSLQSLAVEKMKYNELQVIIDVLHPYLEQHATLAEKMLIEKISNDDADESSKCGNEIGMINGTLQEQMQHALFQINENLFGDEVCFEWLLMAEELYVDERWLKCVMTHAKSFVSVKIVKMLLDVLSVLYGFNAMQEGIYSNIYTSLKKVVLELLPFLTLPEQREVILYNFDLMCLHFDSYKHSFFVPPGNQSSASLAKETITATMNKIVNNSGQGFTKDVINSIVQSCLVAPYLTLKELLSEAVKHNGFDVVICKLLQIIPWLSALTHKDHDSLIIQVLRQIISSLTSTKQEEQYLKLVEKLMQPYMHPDFETKESPLVQAAKIFQDLVIPLLTREDDDVTCPTLVLNILMKSLSCSLNSTEEVPHWIINQQPLQLLFILLEMYEDCEQFWEDWVAASSENSTEMNDVALDEAWNEMNVILKLVEEYLVPLLSEDVNHEPARYYGNIPWMQDHFYQQDWIELMLIIPLLQKDVFNECKIKIPKPLIKLMSSHLNAEPIEKEVPTRPFWAMYFKGCALSNEISELYLSKLKQMHPRESEANINDSEEIIHALAQLLPFSSWVQWRRIFNIGLEMMKYGYLILPQEWRAELTELPEISKLDSMVVSTSELLVLILLDISSKHWATSYVWNITLKNYVSKIKEISFEIGEEDKLQVFCHLLAHLAYIAFKIVPEGFQENVTIILLDIFNQCLTCVSTEDIDKNSLHYLQGIINMASSPELKLTMTSKMQKMLSNNASKYMLI